MLTPGRTHAHALGFEADIGLPLGVGRGLDVDAQRGDECGGRRKEEDAHSRAEARESVVNRQAVGNQQDAASDRCVERASEQIADDGRQGR